jgi:leucyl aminopeptidase
MNLLLDASDLTQVKVGLLGLLCPEDGFAETPAFRALDEALGGLVHRLVAEEQFKGKKGQTLAVHTHGKLGADRLLLVGAGSQKEFSPTELRGFCARVVKAGAAAQVSKVAAAFPAFADLPVARAAQLLAEGALLGGYRFDRYLTGDRKKPFSVADVVLAGCEPGKVDAAQPGIVRGRTVARAVMMARDLVNEPAGTLTPTVLGEIAKEMAAKTGLAVEVLDRRACQERGMGMFLAVAQGSDEEPRFIHLTYRPKGTPKKKVALIGKGVTFDSGGLSLKPSNAMEDMKIDMSGAAAVISAMGVLADLGCEHEVHAFAACAENMPSGKSYKLGDVLTSMAGKTVEINNTDAEGRLTLGDAIHFAITGTQPDELFDFATLTGACMVALGPHMAGVMSNHPALCERWLAAARTAGEDMWQLPLPDKLRDQLKSDVADMRNTGDRFGGALTAGLFLKEFVGETPWVHVDLAGPASADKESGHVPKGGTGFAVATILEYLTASGT